MVKGMLLVPRRSDLSRAEFIRHYEQVHVPLVLSHFLGLRGNVRNHVLPDGAPDLPFDCVTEFWWDTREQFDRAVAHLQSEAGRAIREDEERFIDRDRMVMFLVDERVSDCGRAVTTSGPNGSPSPAARA
jgi:uncharacterized protein (TIGR02118 family)